MRALLLTLTLSLSSLASAYVGDEIWFPPPPHDREQLIELSDEDYLRCLDIDENGAAPTAEKYKTTTDLNSAWFWIHCYTLDPIEPNNTYGI